jgi:hypothetical protein
MMGDKSGIEATLSKAVHEVNRSSATASSTRSPRTSAARPASAAGSPACKARRSPSGASPSSPAPTTSARPPPSPSSARPRLRRDLRRLRPRRQRERPQRARPHRDDRRRHVRSLKGADALVVSTDWDEFKSPDFDKDQEPDEGQGHLRRPQPLSPTSDRLWPMPGYFASCSNVPSAATIKRSAVLTLSTAKYAKCSIMSSTALGWRWMRLMTLSAVQP